MKRKFFTTKKKLMALGAVMFSMGLVTSVTVTYAWYSLLEISYISDLNMEVSADMALDFGYVHDGEIDYSKSTWTKEDFGYEEFYLNDLSGMFQKNWYPGINYRTGMPKLYTGYQSLEYQTVTEFANEGFLQCEFYLRSNIDCAIMLGEDSYFTPNYMSNAVIAREEGRNVEDLNAIVDAVRISFFFENNYVIAKGDDKGDQHYGGLLDLNGDGYYDYKDNKEILYGEYDGEPTYYVEPSEEPYYDYDDQNNKEILYGEYDGEPTYYVEPSEEPYIDYGKDKGAFVANHKPGVERVDLSSVSIKNEEAKPLRDLMFIEDEMISQKIEPLLTLEANVAKRLVITTYLEGWDEHMTDVLSKASMDMHISFVPLYNYK